MAPCFTPTAAPIRSGCRARRWRSWWTAPGPATRSAPGSCPRGWTRSRRPRPWSAAAAWRPARSAWSARGRCCNPGARTSRLAVTSYLEQLFSLGGRVAVVTGGSSGIGRGIALALGQAGAVDRAAQEAAAAFGPPDVLVNCAAVNLRPPLAELTIGGWDTTIAVNLTAPFLLGQHFGPGMAARGWGRIINISSQQADRAFGNSGAYGASKGGLASLTRSQSEAWAARGVCCNAISPGFVATPLTASVAGDPVRWAALAARTMRGRNGDPADFAGAAVFLASPASDYVTGQVIRVDGGFSAT